MNGFSGVLRLEAQAFGVKVTTVCPGGIDTPFWKAMDYYPFPDDVDPARDFLQPEEIADIVVDVARRSDRFVVPEITMLPMMTK